MPPPLPSPAPSEPLPSSLTCPICCFKTKTAKGMRGHLASPRHCIEPQAMASMLELARTNRRHSPYAGDLAKCTGDLAKCDLAKCSPPPPPATSDTLTEVTTSSVTYSIAAANLGLTFHAPPPYTKRSPAAPVRVQKVSRKSPLARHAPELTGARLTRVAGEPVLGLPSLARAFTDLKGRRPLDLTFEVEAEAAEAYFEERQRRQRLAAAANPRERRLPPCIELVLSGAAASALAGSAGELRSASDRHGSNALHYACGAGLPAGTLDFLVDEVGLGADEGNVPRSRDTPSGSVGRSPLHWAARNGHLDTVK